MTVAGRPIVIFNIKGEYFRHLPTAVRIRAVPLCHGVLTGHASASKVAPPELSRKGEIIVRGVSWLGVSDLRTGQVMASIRPRTKVRTFESEL